VSAAASSTTRFRRRLARAVPFSVDLVRLAAHPRWEVDVWRDYFSTRRGATGLRELTPSGPGVALIALYRDNVFEAKMAMIGGTALRLDGLRTVVAIADSRSSRSRRFVKALGADEVVDREALDARLTDADDRIRHSASEDFLSKAGDSAAAKDWTFEGHQAGMHILSSLIRLTFDGDPDLVEHGALLRQVADDTLLQYQRCGLLLDDVQPELVLVQEANYAFNGPLVDLATARGIDVIQTITTWRDDALMSKRLTAATRRVDAKSVDPATLGALDVSDPWTESHDAALDEDFERRYGGHWKLGGQFQPSTQHFDADELPPLLGIDPAKPTAVVFAHVLWDASLFFGVDVFDNYADWLTETVRAAIRNDSLNWVIKAHPANVFRQSHGDVKGEAAEVVLLRDIAPDPPAHVRVLLPDTPVSTMSLYRFADIAITVRGTPGLEMACFGKPVITAGTGSYSGLGFTLDSTSREEYLRRLSMLPDVEGPPCDTASARRYAHTLLLRRPWVPEPFRIHIDLPDQGWHPIDHNVMVPTEVAHAPGSLAMWANWARRQRSADHVPA
jgi:hypothetical protein